MKWIIASDIHGSAECCQKLLWHMKNEKADKLLLLGDILYHGPRNDLPNGWGPKSVIEQLNEISDKVISVRGNCDAEVDNALLNFSVTDDFVRLNFDGVGIFATHGHIYGPYSPPVLNKGDILLCGHSHIPALEMRGDYIYMNPGSVSLPRGGSERGFILYDNGTFFFKTLDGETYRTYCIKN
ncbi:MAG: phosphodiesterase [Clostridia bacterium]|nr:phosphodiesterase [Clostridia bacterium]